MPPWARPADDPQRLIYARRERFVLTDLISVQLSERDRFRIIDGGARDAFDDPRWRALDPAHATLHGFEVDAANCAALNRIAAEAGFDYHFHPIGLWSSDGEVTFYDNLAPGGGSLYPQNTALTDRWLMHMGSLARDIFRPTDTFPVPVTTLANWASGAGIDDIDFIKLNVQGAEVEILNEAGNLPDKALGMQLEVSFCESYHDRPYFTDVDTFMRERGYAFFDFIGPHYVHRADSPVITKLCLSIDQHWARGQLIEAQALYLRDPIAQAPDDRRGPFGANTLTDDFTLAKLLKLVALSEVWGQVDYAFELLVFAGQRLTELGDKAGAARVNDLLQEGCARYREHMWCW
jgi:FkbM family methyltransferase